MDTRTQQLLKNAALYMREQGCDGHTATPSHSHSGAGYLQASTPSSRSSESVVSKWASSPSKGSSSCGNGVRRAVLASDTPLYAAAKKGHTEVKALLLKAGAV